jgi:malto-oligosyltrehalose synthase
MPKVFRATYRLQLHRDFTFYDLEKILGYISDLGISHLYLSPILSSSPGSMHGYDGTNPQSISEERGGEAGFARLMYRMKKRSDLEGVILDIVPNHLAFHHQNPAWWDLLKKGTRSWYWQVFDLRTEKENSKIVIPVLGAPLLEILAKNEITITKYNNEPALKYYDHIFPLATESKVNFQNATSRDMERLLNQQHYKLVPWQNVQEINYRRFFDINSLAGIRIEDRKVFDWDHKKISELMNQYPHIHGLRVDHIDGLKAPGAYLERLKEFSSHVWVEKILGEKEELPPYWQTEGTTGYEFSILSSRVFVDLRGLLLLHSHYLKKIDNQWELFRACVYDSKKEILLHHFPAELNDLLDRLEEILSPQERRVFSRKDLEEALIEVTACLRVYRTYVVRGRSLENNFLTEAFLEAEGRGSLKSLKALTWLKNIFFKPRGSWNDKQYEFIKRWEQVTGPVMAKGLEDTALYRYCPLLSLNAVGGNPDWIGEAIVEFHRAQQIQLREHPLNMNASSTHDTKQSGDVRSRIHVLSELPTDWTALAESMLKMIPQASTASKRGAYLVLESVIGTWPLNGKVDKEYVERIQQYFIKAAREAKLETSWTEVNDEYEKKLELFVKRLLQPNTLRDKVFFTKLRKFAERCSYFGAFNSLSNLALRVCGSGLPDFYQGTELWDLSLVDPDNRRPVDYELRSKLLKKQFQGLRKNRAQFLKDILQHWQTGEVKLFVTRTLLFTRKRHPDLFTYGEYLPLSVEGPSKNHHICLLRTYKNRKLLVVVPRLLADFEKLKKDLTIKNKHHLDGILQLPASSQRHKWRHVFTGETLTGAELSTTDLYKSFPLAVLISY